MISILISAPHMHCFGLEILKDHLKPGMIKLVNDCFTYLLYVQVRKYLMSVQVQAI